MPRWLWPPPVDTRPCGCGWSPSRPVSPSARSTATSPPSRTCSSPRLTREFVRLDDDGDWATIADTPRQRLDELNARLRHEWQDRPALTEAVTRAFVVADGTVDVMRAEAIIARMMARAIAGGDPTSHQIQIAAVVADVWLANLTAWIRHRTTTAEVGQRLHHTIRLLVSDEPSAPIR